MDISKELSRIIDHYGEGHQHEKAKEELQELVEAIDDYIKIPTPENRFHLIDEMADVEVMLEQLKIMNVCRDEVAGRVRYKINRQMERIRNGE